MALVLTKKYVIAIGVVACIAIAGLGVNYVVMPSVSSVTEAQANIVEAEDSKDGMNARLSGLQTSQAQYAQIESINSSLTSQFPETGQTQQLIEQLFAAAEQNGMSRNQITNLSFEAPTITTPEVAAPVAAPAEGEAAGAPAEGDAAAAPAAATAVPEGFAKLNLSITLEGSQQQVSGYLDSLNKMDRVITIRDLSLNPESGNVSLSFSAVAYVYKAIPEPGQLQTPEELAEEESVEVTP